MFFLEVCLERVEVFVLCEIFDCGDFGVVGYDGELCVVFDCFIVDVYCVGVVEVCFVIDVGFGEFEFFVEEVDE